MKEGLFGGTFNPLHNGHIQVISHVKKTFAIDRIHLIPCGIPPHKPFQNLAPGQDRFEMIENTLRAFPGLCVSDLELRRSGPSFTIDTIRQFLDKALPETEPYFILGTDAFFDMGTWKQPMDIFKKINIILMTRAGEKKASGEIAAFLAFQVSRAYEFDHASMRFHHPELKSVHICRTPEIKISSTLVRNRIKRNQSIHSLVPGPVEDIIIKKGLYS